MLPMAQQEWRCPRCGVSVYAEVPAVEVLCTGSHRHLRNGFTPMVLVEDKKEEPVMTKQAKDPTKFSAKISGGFDVDPVDSDEIVPGDQVMVVSMVKVRGVGIEEEERSGEAAWVATMKVRQAGIVRDEDLLNRIYDELGLQLPDPKLPFPAPTQPLAFDDDEDEDDDDEDNGEDEVVPAMAAPLSSGDEALKAFLAED